MRLWGEWLVLDGDLKACGAAAFDDAYTSDEPVEFPAVEAAPVMKAAEVPDVMPTSADTSVPIVR